MKNDSVAAQAFAPIDYSGYQNVAKSMQSAGQGVDKAMNDWATFEKSKEKEQMRQQAINDILSKKPYMAKVLRPETDLESLGKGLSQLGVGTVLYDQASKVIQEMPSREQFDQAVFAASPEAFAKFQADWEKKISEGEKGVSSSKELKTFGDIQLEHPDWTQEQLNAEAARQGIKPTNLDAEGLAVSQRMAISASQLEKNKLAGKRYKLDEAKAATIRGKDEEEKFFKHLNNMNDSTAELARRMDDKDKWTKYAMQLSMKKQEDSAAAERTGTTFNSKKYDDNIADAYKKADHFNTIIRSARATANAATDKFDAMYPGFRLADADLDSDLERGGAEEPGSPPQITPVPSPGAASPAKGPGFVQ